MKKTLGDYAFELEKICQAIDAMDMDAIPQSVLDEFAGAQQNMADKTDNWIGYLDALNARIETLKAQAERINHGLRVSQNLRERLKSYLVTLIQATPTVAHDYRGTMGHLRVQKNGQPMLKTNVKIASKSVPNALNGDRPKEIEEYVSTVYVAQLDVDSIKRDLKEGKALPWASLEHGYHLRIGI